jgi:hypothetical protein
LLLAALLAPARADAAPRPGTIQQRIDALLKHRLKPEPLPVDAPNPFLLVSRESRDSATGGADSQAATDKLAASEPPVSSEAEILVDCATRLRVGGIIVINGQTQVVINGVRLKEGDPVASDWNNAPIYLRLIRLLPGHIVLRLGDTEMTRKF